ncbi:MAG: hypothetical protein GY822_33035 [Deltaproteobacteria bacterium]|nr:hypothetical protein [Deltaproteobacteria bacterium]
MKNIETFATLAQWNAADATALLLIWHASGLPLVVFARRHFINEDRLKRWQKKLSPEIPQVTFIEVRLP